MPSMAVTTSSPGRTSTTPSGVPVRITSPGGQRHEAGQVFDQVRNVEHEVARVALLRDLAVHRRRQREVARIGHVGGVDQPRTQHRARVAVLHAQVRPVVVLEIVADRVVVGHRVAGHDVQRVRAPHAARRLADHDRQLAFVVHERGVVRSARLPAMADQRARTLEEHERLLLRGERQLLRVVGVVETERDDRADVERRQPDDGVLGHHAAIGQPQPVAVRASPRASRRHTRRGRASSAPAPSATSVLASVPTPSIVIATRCPARARGAPPGTPVSSTSPGSSVMNSVTSASSARDRPHDVARVRLLPQRRRRSSRGWRARPDRPRAGARSPTGPIGQKPSRHLQADRRPVEVVVRHADVVARSCSRRHDRARRFPPRGTRRDRSPRRGSRPSPAPPRPAGTTIARSCAECVLRGFT